MNVLATDLLESRLRLAKKFGAKWAQNVGQASHLSLNEKEKKSKNGDRRAPFPALFDAAILAVPSDVALEDAFQRIRGAGQILLFAHTKRPNSNPTNPKSNNPSNLLPGFWPADLSRICVDEKDLLGSYSADFTLQREVARLVFSRQMDVRSLISHRFSLEKAAEGVDLASHPTPESLKIIVCS
jgi:L-iditol 2-dehydrogenase